MDNLIEGCVRSINEIFDGDYPHLPRGCISQAWSVGKLLRCIVEDVLYFRQNMKTFSGLVDLCG